MDTEELDESLRLAAPARLTDSAALRQQAIEIVMSSARSASTDRRLRVRRRLFIGIPLAALAIIALTAGSVAVGNYLQALGTITTIPINYVTDTGKAVSCHVSIVAGDGDPKADAAVAAYIRSKDWTGIGQKIYDRAVANPWKPNPKDSWIDANGKTHAGDGPMSAADKDAASWNDAVGYYIPGQVPAKYQGGYGPHLFTWGWGSADCDGTLH